MNTLPRRSAIAASLTYWAGNQRGAWAAGEADAGEHASADVTAPEDLMRELGEQFEEIEHSEFGKDGFSETIRHVVRLEYRVGISSLDAFTAHMTGRDSP